MSVSWAREDWMSPLASAVAMIVVSVKVAPWASWTVIAPGLAALAAWVKTNFWPMAGSFQNKDRSTRLVVWILG
ncbi:hypothetical protein OFN05_17425 [Acinetobacter baumannii]|nr:hypothetical protein [Acinetobacter baumannii]